MDIQLKHRPIKSQKGKLLTSVLHFTLYLKVTKLSLGRRGRDRMVVGFTATYAIDIYHH